MHVTLAPYHNKPKKPKQYPKNERSPPPPSSPSEPLESAGMSYSALQSLRREQAARSVLILNQSQHTQRHLLHACRMSGRCRINYYATFSRRQREHILVEMDSVAAVDQLLKEAGHMSTKNTSRMQTRLLVFGDQKAGSKNSKAPSLLLPEKKIWEAVSAKKDLSAQMVALHSGLCLPELHTRLRYFTCQLIEDSVRTLFPSACVLPFGSSVNGFGRYDCDVDMTLELEGSDEKHVPTKSYNGFYFMSKESKSVDRKHTVDVLRTLWGYLKLCTPKAHQVIGILQARVPIIKLEMAPPGVQCDITVSNDSAVQMSELLYGLCALDARVQPFVFTVRAWARAVDVTSDNPQISISNFMLTLLTIYVLQARPQPVLPPINLLRQKAGVVEDTDYSFVSLWSQMPKSSNDESLEVLLKEFFRFYSTFDFSAGAISLNEAAIVPRHTETEGEIKEPMWLENPLERDMNVARIVQEPILSHFQSKCREAYETLQSSHSQYRLVELLSQSVEVPTHRPKITLDMDEMFTEDTEEEPDILLTDENTQEELDKLLTENTGREIHVEHSSSSARGR